MKFKKSYVGIVAVAFTVGIASGVVLEKGYGVGFLKRIGVKLGASSQPQQSQMGESSISKEHQGNLQLFILAGQSNMSGLGDLPQSGTSTDPRVYVFGNDYRWKLAKEPVDDPTNQVDRVSEDKLAGFGPSMSFASTLLEKNPNRVIGLIPCAKGGASIAEWRRNLDDTTLYGSCLKRVRAASAMGRVTGILFFQGEIDTVDPREAPDRTFLPNRWAEEFAVLVKDWRRDLSLPELPIVLAQIGTNTEPDRFKNWAVVKKQQQNVRLPFSRMITTDDLALMDYVHFTTESYQTIGQRFANAYLDLVSEKPGNSPKK
ncbi:MAG: sialate O-acetylesterase [Kovacikia sp.]